MQLLRRAIPVLEENSDGSANKEIEYEFYARVVDLEELTKATSKESHEQWEFYIPDSDDNACGGRMRIRKTVPNLDGTPEYVITTKTRNKDGSNLEVSVPTTEPNFVQFKLFCEKGMIKDRYFFPVEGSDLVFEVDMYKKPGGGYWEWCKIDLEIPEKGVAVPPFPIDLADIITAQHGERTDEEITKIKSLFEYEFLTPNQLKTSS